MADTETAPKELNLSGVLKRAHGVEPDASDWERNVVLVMDRHEGVRKALFRALSRALPGFTIEAVASADEVVDKMAGDTAQRVALVMVDMDGIGDNEKLLNAFRGGSRFAGFAAVPLIAISQYLGTTLDEGRVTLEQLKRRGIDGILDKPSGITRVPAVITEAIMRRSELFQQIETAKRKEVMDDFLTHYLKLCEVWKEALKDVSFYPRDAEDLVAQDSKEAVLVEIMMALTKLTNQLKEWQSTADTDLAKIGKLSHDIANSLASSLANFDYLKDLEGVGASDRTILESLKNDLVFLNAHRQAMDLARHGKTTWFSVQRSQLTLRPEQNLEFPAGMVFCIIDDSPAVLDTCAKEIRDKGGVVYTAKNKAELAELIGNGNGGCAGSVSGIDVFLVDNDLGAFGTDGAVRGNQLLASIKTKFPRALVLGHTFEAVDINAKPDNPYKAAGVPVIGKREWTRLTGILKCRPETT